MKYLVAPHSHYDVDHLDNVMREMKHYGAPTLKACRDHDELRLLEGTHRMIAAKKMGCPINIIECAQDEVIKHDFQDIDSPMSVGELLEYLDHGHRAFVLPFEDEQINFVGA